MEETAQMTQMNFISILWIIQHFWQGKKKKGLKKYKIHFLAKFLI